MRVRSRRSIASVKRLSARSSSASSARALARTPRPQSVPLAAERSSSRRGRPRRFPLAAVRSRFDQFEETPTVEAEVLEFASLAGGGECLLVSGEPVVEHRGGVSGQAEHPAFAPGDSVRGGRLDQAGASAGFPRQAESNSEWYLTGARWSVAAVIEFASSISVAAVANSPANKVTPAR